MHNSFGLGLSMYNGYDLGYSTIDLTMHNGYGDLSMHNGSDTGISSVMIPIQVSQCIMVMI